MIHVFLLSIVSQGAPVYPVLPAGLNTAFVTAAVRVERCLEAKDFTSAESAATFLPIKTPSIEWDESGIPGERRAEFREAKDAILHRWALSSARIDVVESKPAQIAFHFVDSLPPNDAGTPEGASFAFSDLPGEPRLKVLIALHRQESRLAIDPSDVYNEVAYAIGRYLGLERGPGFGSVSTRTEATTNYRIKGTPYEYELIRSALAISGQLRSMAKGKEAANAAQPKLNLGARRIEGLHGYQAAPLGFSLKISNAGQSPLAVSVRPDCGCLSPVGPTLLKAGESGEIEVSVDTGNYLGKLNHSLLVYSNDPDNPLVEVPVSMRVEPYWHFVQGGAGIASVGPNGGDADAFLLLSDNAKLKILTIQTSGPKSTATFEPWSGEMADPAVDDPARPRKGYKIHVHLLPSDVPGRLPATVTMQTDNDNFPVLQTEVQFQKGIVASPPSVFMGEVDPHPRHLSFILSKATAFSITKVATDSPFLTASFTALRSNVEYRVDLEYNGKGDFGMYHANVTVFTDDPRQSKVVVPVSGMIK